VPKDFAPIDLADDIEIPAHVTELIPRSVARELFVLPVAETPDSLIVAVTDPTDIEIVEKLRFILNRNIRLIHVTREWLSYQVRKRYGDIPDDGAS